jgi:hypothetical protein
MFWPVKTYQEYNERPNTQEEIIKDLHNNAEEEEPIETPVSELKKQVIENVRGAFDFSVFREKEAPVSVDTLITEPQYNQATIMDEFNTMGLEEKDNGLESNNTKL